MNYLNSEQESMEPRVKNTSFRGCDKDSSDNDLDIEGTANKILKKAARLPYEKLYDRHVHEHRRLFNRVTFDLKNHHDAR